MGGKEFIHVVLGEDDVRAAFEMARDQALWDHGHTGYTGTIAEKDCVTVISKEPVSPVEAKDVAQRLLDTDDPRIADDG